MPSRRRTRCQANLAVHLDSPQAPATKGASGERLAKLLLCLSVPVGTGTIEVSWLPQMVESEAGITALLRAHHEGDDGAFDRLVPLVYDELKGIARHRVGRRGAPGVPGRTTLVHEAYLQLAEERGISWQDRSHFFAVCARVMRRIVVDHARRRGAAKRGGGQRDLTLEPERLGSAPPTETILAVHEVLDRLADLDPRLVRVVECRFFSGMTEEETAEALEMSLRTVQRSWTRARAWIQKELS